MNIYLSSFTWIFNGQGVDLEESNLFRDLS
jgi:hypothetical protein